MKKHPGDSISPRVVTSISGAEIPLPDPDRLTHLQFRRFAGCPICNVHLRTFILRAEELAMCGLAEVAVFHSSRESMLAHHAEAPFALIGDPQKALYREFGVETSWKAVADPRSWMQGMRGVRRGEWGTPKGEEGITGLPADFLIDSRGTLVVCHYGSHANDQWSVDEVLRQATVYRSRMKTAALEPESSQAR